MPGLGDALSKAFEDSMHDIDALVEKAAQEEEDIAEAIDEAAGGSDVGGEDEASVPVPAEPAGEGVGAGVGLTEKTTLFAAEDLPLDETQSPTSATDADAQAEAFMPAEPPRRTESTRRIIMSEDMAGEAARSGIDATRILEEAALRGASAEPGDVGTAPPAGEDVPKTVEIPAAEVEAVAAASVESVPTAEPISDPSAKTQVTMAEPVAPFAQFAPSGIIRRKLRKGDTADAPAPVAVPVATPASPAEPEVAAAAAPPSPEGRAPAPPAGADEDVLATCRRLPALKDAEDYRIPLLTDGIGGLVEKLKSREDGSSSAVAVCGAGSHFGTTTVAVACALKLAEDKSQRVLLVDADFRAPSIAGLVGDSGSGPDLKAVIKGEATLSETILYSPEDNLAVLPIYGWGESSGAALGRVRSLLKGEIFAALLAVCEKQFDFVVLDAGSATEWDGPALVAAAVGHAVVAVRSGRITTKKAREVKSNLERRGSRLEGSVLTFA